MSSPSRVHAYSRVSSQVQEDGYSLDTQEAACRAWAAEHALPIASVAREVWSGADRHRPELDALLEQLLPGDIVISYSLDRLSRTQIDTAILIDRIESAGASLQLVTENFEQSATGTFLRSAKAFANELEREKIRERTQRGRRARLASGKPIAGSRPPYGYRWCESESTEGKKARSAKVRLEEDPETGPIVRGMFAKALAGASLRSIAADLEIRGIPTPYERGRWSAQTVRRILTRDTYSTGDRTAFAVRFERQTNGRYKERPGREDERVVLPGVAPPLVSAQEQAAVITRLSMNKRLSPRNNSKPESALLRAGFVRCAYCNWALRVQFADDESKAKYACSYHHKGQCVGPAIQAHILDREVWGRVRELLRDPRIIEHEMTKHRDDGGLERDLSAVERLLMSIAGKQANIARTISVLDDDAAAAPLLVELKSLAARKTAAEAEREDLKARIADAASDAARVRTLTEYCRTVGANLDTLNYDERRLALDALGVEVRLWKHGTTDEEGKPMRWDMKLNPARQIAAILSPDSCSRCAARLHREK